MSEIQHKSISDMEYHVIEDLHELHIEIKEEPTRLDTCMYSDILDIHGNKFPTCSRLEHNTIINKNGCELCEYYKKK